MKIPSRLVGIVFLLLVGCADAEPERPLFDRLLSSEEDRDAALAQVLRDPTRVDAFALLLAADRARSRGEIADAAFLLNAGRIRADADMKIYPEADTSDQRPSLMLGTLKHRTGEDIGLAIATDRDAYARVITRLEDWHAPTGRDYSPGWVYENALPPEEAAAERTAAKHKRLGEMRDMAMLLADDEYFSLLKEVRKLQAGTALGPELDEIRLETVVRRAREIEQAKNIDGAFSALE